jgi:hypothetical protein
MNTGAPRVRAPRPVSSRPKFRPAFSRSTFQTNPSGGGDSNMATKKKAAKKAAKKATKKKAAKKKK